MKLLALVAHPDDIEIFMYGFISICKQKGDEVILGIATDGSLGNVTHEKSLKERRVKEAIKGLALLGKPDFLELPDGHLSSSLGASEIIKHYIDSIKPDLILTHDPNDYHPDHRALSRFVKDASGFHCPVLYSDTLMGIDFKPEFYIDITNVFNEKIKSILAHKSQQPEKFVKVVKLTNRFRAAQCNAPDNNYAEAYRMANKFPFADIRSLIPSAPSLRSFYSSKSDGLI